MKKFLTVIIAILTLIFTVSLFGCNNSYDKVGGATNGGDVIISSADRKISYYVNIDMTVEDIAKIKETLSEKTEEFGGYIERSSDSYSKDQISDSQTVYRIPTDKINDFLKLLDGKGKINGKNVVTNDFTNGYVSAEAKKASLINRKTMLSDLLLDTSLTATDKINLIDEISKVDQQIQEIEILLANYDSMADYSTISVNLYVKAPVTGVIVPLVIIFVTPAIVLSAIFIPKKIKAKKKENK